MKYQGTDSCTLRFIQALCSFTIDVFYRYIIVLWKAPGCLCFRNTEHLYDVISLAEDKKEHCFVSHMPGIGVLFSGIQLWFK
ncbi:hypothetical protein [Planctobacterium marinum]|uniref:hypothetical protein n=1 Tax=Planctobacterium marinum TaxID=1631968 RepID=UPI001E45F839|nr:hypothetical protein [Planctobacterium marinum]